MRRHEDTRAQGGVVAPLPDFGYVTIHMSLLLREKLAISSIFPLQKGGSRTPSNSKYLLSNSIGVLGVSASLSAIVETSRQCRKKKTRTPTWTALCTCGLMYLKVRRWWPWWGCLKQRCFASGCCGSRRRAEELTNGATEKWCNTRAWEPASGPLSRLEDARALQKQTRSTDKRELLGYEAGDDDCMLCWYSMTSGTDCMEPNTKKKTCSTAQWPETGALAPLSARQRPKANNQNTSRVIAW